MAHQQYSYHQQQQQQQPQHSYQQQQQPRSRPPPPSSSSSVYSPPPLPVIAPLPSTTTRIENPFESSQPYYPPSNSQQQQQQRQQYQSRPYQSGQQQNQPLQHSPLPPPPPLSDQNITIPKRGSSANLAEVFSQGSFVSATNTTIHAPRPTPAGQSTFNHPLALQDINLEPPQRSFVNFDRPSSADRPNSIASFSNLSTHSNEPLNPPVDSARKPAQSRAPPKNKKKLSKRIMNTARGQQMQTARSITPQPWHPDYRRDSTHNPLDLPEHRRNSSTESSLGLNEIDSDDRNQDKRDGTKLHKTRKNIFARLGRSRTKVLTTYKISGTGRTAQFSNERLYLHWIRFGILQGGIAVTLLSYGNEVGSWVGVGTLTLALLTLVYSTSLYHTRHIHMITKRKDVVYFAKTIPTLLCVGLILLYGGNFIVAMSMGDAAASRPPWTTDDPYSFTSVF